MNLIDRRRSIKNGKPGECLLNTFEGEARVGPLFLRVRVMKEKRDISDAYRGFVLLID
jgi:hypothetical protein